MRINAVQPADKQNMEQLAGRSGAPEATRKPTPSGTASVLLDLQRTHGNRYVQTLLQTTAVRSRDTAELPSATLAVINRTDETPSVTLSPATTGAVPVSRKTEVVSGVVGAGVGAAVGAGIGFLVGGPVGAVIGGAIGLVGGAIVGALAGRLTGPITDPGVQAAMRQAWLDSDAASAANRHEEGGYIVRRADGSLGVERWPRGAGASINPAPRDNMGRYNGLEVLGEFHTHPNPPVDELGRQWEPGPSPSDINGITAENYPGDSYVISRDAIYRVRRDGRSDTLGNRTDIIGR